MPAYPKNSFTSTPQLLPGVPVYLFGSYNFDQSPLRGQVQTVAIATDVATVTFLLTEGAPANFIFTPYVGSTISIQQTATSSGVFNVNDATVVSLSYNSTTNILTVTFALTNGNVSATADSGNVQIDIPELSEVLANGASIAACQQHSPSEQRGERTYAVDVQFPGGLPAAATVVFQAALHNVDSDFATLGTVTVVAGGAVSAGYSNLAEFTLSELQYFRVLVSGVSGSANIVAKVLG